MFEHTDSSSVYLNVGKEISKEADNICTFVELTQGTGSREASERANGNNRETHNGMNSSK